MKFFDRALLVCFAVGCAGIVLVSVSHSRIGDGNHDLLTIGSGVIGVVFLVIAAKIFTTALSAGDSN